MAPKPRPAAKTNTAAVAKGAANGSPSAKSASPAAKASAATPPPEKEREAAAVLSVAEAEASLLRLEDHAWEELTALDSPPEVVRHTLRGLLLLLGDPDASTWASATSALREPHALLAALRALGPWGFSESQLSAALAALREADAADPGRSSGGGSAPATPATPAAPAKARARATPAKVAAKPAAKTAAKAKAASPEPPCPGFAAVLGLKALAEALVAQRRNEKPPPFPMVWPVVPYAQLHTRLQQAMASRQAACLVCSGPRVVRAALLYFERCGVAVCDLARLQVEVHLAKRLDASAARAELGGHLREALSSGRRLALFLGETPPNLRHFCDSSQVPIEAFDCEQAGEAARTLGLEAAAEGFHLALLVQCSRARAEQLLPQSVPSSDDLAVLVLDPASLPPAAALAALAAERAPGAPGAPSLRAGLQLLALAPEAPGAPQAEGAAAEGQVGAVEGVNREDFEYAEAFGGDWEQRWSRGPAKTDENGKPIRESLISAQLVRYPANPKDAKPCLQLLGGAANAPCTGIWTSFSPLVRPTEVEFEFTMTGKVDLPNACVVFTERAFEGALPDCKVGIQFTVRGGMQLSGGGGNLVRISNDGKLQSDKWSKVLMRIDWTQKAVVAQVDTKGKGYAPAVQTVPFRDSTCTGFGFVYIYNTDVQATCWFHSLRIRQEASAERIDSEALDARAHLAARLQQREYQRAVDADMEVGMKMGAIKATKEHGMNLAQEQAANSGGGLR